MWEDREFSRVMIPRLFVGSSLGDRFENRPPAKSAPNMFGFMRPVTLGQDRVRARRMAETMAALMVRAL
jgi:hypothetical protein